jgi:hypothetical protein
VFLGSNALYCFSFEASRSDKNVPFTPFLFNKIVTGTTTNNWLDSIRPRRLRYNRKRDVLQEIPPDLGACRRQKDARSAFASTPAQAA